MQIFFYFFLYNCLYICHDTATGVFNEWVPVYELICFLFLLSIQKHEQEILLSAFSISINLLFRLPRLLFRLVCGFDNCSNCTITVSFSPTLFLVSMHCACLVPLLVEDVDILYRSSRISEIYVYTRVSRKKFKTTTVSA